MMTNQNLTERATGAGDGNRMLLLSLLLLILLALGFLFRDGLAEMARMWETAEYSHGYLIPIVAILLALQQRDRLAAASLRPSWSGAAILFAGLLLFAVGELATIYTVVQYAMLVTLLGLVVAGIGWRGAAILWAPLVYLIFMIPLPNFLYVALSAKLQLLSSLLGVAVIRLAGISVFLEGNVIDLGTYKLQVAEACSGLRYLFPLLSFGFLVAYLYRGPFWQRAVLFLSAIPITILMNSLRIGFIGVLVDGWGIAAAEGFMHLFEGWVVFILCLVLLLGEAALLQRWGGPNLRIRDAFALDFRRSANAPPRAAATTDRPLRLGGPLLAGLGLVAIALVGSALVQQRAEIVPERQSFLLFPTQIGEWEGTEAPLDLSVLGALKLDDYFNADFRSSISGNVVNLYIAYYASQRKGASAHSPRSCIPGGGWEIMAIEPIELDLAGPDGPAVSANRVVISRGLDRQVVYYWFQQRGRMITNEYLVKWFILQDSILRHRTDGAMVRLVTALGRGEPEAAADARLLRFAHAIYPELPAYIPD